MAEATSEDALVKKSIITLSTTYLEQKGFENTKVRCFFKVLSLIALPKPNPTPSHTPIQP